MHRRRCLVGNRLCLRVRRYVQWLHWNDRLLLPRVRPWGLRKLVLLVGFRSDGFNYRLRLTRRACQYSHLLYVQCLHDMLHLSGGCRMDLGSRLPVQDGLSRPGRLRRCPPLWRFSWLHWCSDFGPTNRYFRPHWKVRQESEKKPLGRVRLCRG